MNEDLLATLMAAIDPVRDLEDSAVDELVPYDNLMNRVLAGIEQPAVHVPRERTSVWHRTSVRVSAVAASAVLVASGAVAFLGSSPTGSSGFALGAVHSSWIAYSTSQSSSGNFGAASRSMAASLVSNGRISTDLRLDGLTISPPSPGLQARVPATQMANELWATTALHGQTKVAFGVGSITLNVSQKGAPKLRNVSVWVAIATSKPCGFTSACSASTIAALPLTVVVNGYGLPNSEVTTGTPIAFVYQTYGRSAAAVPRLLSAIEQISVRWIQDGPAAKGSLHITVGPIPCGALNGYNLATNASGTTLTVKGLVPESTNGDYCSVSSVVQKVVELHGAGATTFLRALTGPMRATN